MNKDGSHVWVLWNSASFPERQVFYATGQDVTGRHRAEEAVAERARQQQAVAELGTRALAGGELGPLYDEAVAVLARTMKAEFASLVELQPGDREFVFKGAYGWERELVDKAHVPLDPKSLCGYSLASDAPFVVEDLSTETRFGPNPLTASHGIVSEMACRLPGHAQSRAVLCVHCTQRRRFTDDDVHFVQAVANIMASAIERYRAEEEAKRFFEPSLQPMGVFGFDGMTKQCNRAFELLLGYSREELLTIPFIELVHPDDYGRVVAEVKKMAEGQASLGFEFKMRCKDGSSKWGLWSGTPFLDLRVFYAGGQDVTDRHLAEEALRASEETLRATGESALDGIVLLDNDGNVARWNAAAERIFGYASDEILGRSLHQTLYPAESRAAFEHGFPHFQQTGEGPAIGKVSEVEALHKDGSRFPVEVSIAAVELHGQWNAVGVVRDITQRKADERQLREYQQFLLSTLDALSAHVAILDENGTLLEVNAAWRRFADANQFAAAGYGVGMNYLEICEAASGECAPAAIAVAQGIREVLAGRQEAFSLEYPCHSPSEERWYLAHVTRFHWEGPRHAVVAHENVTQRRLYFTLPGLKHF